MALESPSAEVVLSSGLSELLGELSSLEDVVLLELVVVLSSSLLELEEEEVEVVVWEVSCWSVDDSLVVLWLEVVEGESLVVGSSRLMLISPLLFGSASSTMELVSASGPVVNEVGSLEPASPSCA